MNSKSSILQSTIDKVFAKILLFAIGLCSFFSPQFLWSQEVANADGFYISGGAQIFIESHENLIVLDSKNHHSKKNTPTISKSTKKNTHSKNSLKLLKEEKFADIETVKEKPEIFFVATSSPNSFSTSRETVDVFLNNFQNYQSTKTVFAVYKEFFSRFIKEKKIISQKVFFLNALYSKNFYGRPPPVVV